MTRGRTRFWVAAAVLVWGGVALLAVRVAQRDDHSPSQSSSPAGEFAPPGDSQPAAAPPDSSPYPAAAPRGAVTISLRRPPRAGILVDLRSGETLWEMDADRHLAIASLTKMMTGLIIAERHKQDEHVRVTTEALAYQGSGIGLLPRGKKVTLGSLLEGLMLVSGNDASIALAQHDAGTVRAFVRRMNRRALELGLQCTRFSSPNGYQDAGNYSCARDLAKLAKADLSNRKLRRIVRQRRAKVHFPIKGGYLELNNNNPLIGEPGITGLKTGVTDRAGRCYVTTAKRRGRELGVVLLHSPDPIVQVHQLLRAGWET
jgi:serine-type D-Ala-D-Ala carboxypeptidase (penicillin-binding protein 5/6)